MIMETRRPSRGRDSSGRTYQRTYKACLPCRQRKAKCDLPTGPDGISTAPPCAKCRREQRPCVFSEKRAWERTKKRKSPEDGVSASSHYSRRLSSNISQTGEDSHLTADRDPTPGTYVSEHHGSARTASRSYSPESRHSRNQSNSALANSMMRTVVSSGNDALNILFEAAAAHSQDNGLTEGAQTRNAHNPTDNATRHESSLNQIHSTVAPEVLAKAIQPVELSDVTKEVLSVWEMCRFVRMGWFTSREAVTFIDLFYKNMSPLSPILTDLYAHHKNHHWLVTRDPVLCCTILMISSRYHLLPGAGGESRNFFIHHRLWQHCQQLVMRLTFGQERSSQPRIRSIGTIEALLLMSEWHPRSLHFPPDSDGWDFDLISVDPEPQDHDDKSSTNRWLEDMIEPARRSDQMSWMLLGSALSLAHELGIFEVDDKKVEQPADYEGFISEEQMRLRRERVQRLLYVYINQLAWRIGCVSLMPQSLIHSILGRPTSTNSNGGGDEWMAFMDSWMDLTKLAKSVTDMFFPTVSFARQHLHSGRYIDLLDHFRPLLVKWKEKHLQPQALNKRFFDILFIEYHFVRVYTHSVGMQAVVERVLADSDPNAEEVRALNIDAIDYEYIQEVIDGCCQILQKVTQLAEIGALRFSPVRIFLRITSSSIFLMKALSLGTRQAKMRESLEVLQQTIQSLRSNALDDIHLSTRYATLLDMHVSRLRRNLLASSKVMKSGQGTTRSSTGPPPPENETPTTAVNAPMTENMCDLGFVPADDWLSLPFDPSMAPFGISSGGQFPAYEGGALNFIWNLPS
ncbi:C6 transcription factor [Aspergillus terreus]|uniref:C6 transcription factor n=1 Tax=Aspergillus terreus TaxID=33178 RepID=A0A5M3Z4H6_ASPTE|nr:hypothetical protein ATETN484_0009030600 [Aspergillus terreus]GFF17757.1 C6 transcription factor [Aspergillus terreus]